jgi:hypothetical protein
MSELPPIEENGGKISIVTAGEYVPLDDRQPDTPKIILENLQQGSEHYRYIPKGREGRVKIQALELVGLAFAEVYPEVDQEILGSEIREKAIAALKAMPQLDRAKNLAPELSVHKPPVIYALRDIIDIANNSGNGNLEVDDETRRMAKNIVRVMHYLDQSAP